MRLSVLPMILLVTTGTALSAGKPSWAFVRAGVAEALSIPFITNMGQLDEEVAFYTISKSRTVYVTSDGQVVHAARGEDGAGRVVFRERLLASDNVSFTGAESVGTLVNCYLGRDAGRWRRDIPAFRSLTAASVYENIDARLVVRDQGVEKIFEVHPGAEVSDIRIGVDAAISLLIDGAGALVVETRHGRVRFTQASAYQLRDGSREMVQVSYRVEGNSYGFTVGDFDRDRPLFIDPLLSSSYLGGEGNEAAYTVQIYDGDVFIAGTAESAEFPGADGGAGRLGDAFVVRLDRDLTTVMAATFIGGSLTEGARDMVVDASGVYIAGYNNSFDFPTTQGAAYAGSSVSGAFLTRLHPKTLRMTASTAFYPNVFAVTLGPDARVYLGGATGDPSFPLSSGSSFLAELQGGADAFVARLDRDLQAVEASTLLGGEGVDIIYNLTVDTSGEVVASGVTNSTAFPVSDGAYDSTYNLDWEETLPWRDGFVARFSADLNELLGSTYLGGGWNDSIQAMVLDGSDVIVAGNTSSVDFPCGNTFGPVDGNDAFVLRLDRTLSTVRSCAMFGGGQAGRGSPDTATDITVKTGERVFVTGRTDADDFPTTPGAFLEKPTGSYTGGFVTSFTPDLAYMEASTLIHGGNEYIHSIALASDRDLYVTGDAQDDAYPVTPGAIQILKGGGEDLVISRFSQDLTGPHLETGTAMVDFKRVPVGKGKTENLTLYNTGGADLRIRDLIFLPASGSVFAVKDSCREILPFDSCQLGLVFTPVTSGPAEGALLVLSSDTFNREKEVKLRGRGVTGPAIGVDKDRVFFGNVIQGRASSERYIAVSNMGTGNLKINEVALGGSDPSSFILISELCTTAPLPSGGHCRISLKFAPVGHGSRSALLSILSSDPAVPAYEVYLEGRCEVPPGMGGSVEDEASGFRGTDRSAHEIGDSDKDWLIAAVTALVVFFLLVVLWITVKLLGKIGHGGTGKRYF